MKLTADRQMVAYPGQEMSCELCGEAIKNGEFGDVDGAIVCPKCLGWYDTEPDPEVKDFYDRNASMELTADKKMVAFPMAPTAPPAEPEVEPWQKPAPTSPPPRPAPKEDPFDVPWPDNLPEPAPKAKGKWDKRLQQLKKRRGLGRQNFIST